MKRALRVLVIVAVVAAAGLYMTGRLVPHVSLPRSKPEIGARDIAPSVSVVRVAPTGLEETVLVTGTLVPKTEILVAPEVDGLRVLELLAEEGDRVVKGQVLARLETATLEAQLAQNEAAFARSKAVIAQARSSIASAEARQEEASNALDRARPLKKSGYLAESAFDQRESAAKTAVAQLASARDGLALAQAEQDQIEAQRRELAWKLGKTDIKAPADGVISRRSARIGGLASAAADPMFRMIANGEIELDAEVTEADMPRIKPEQTATVSLTGIGTIEGKVRLVSPEVERATRLGRVRIFLGANPALRIGAFGRGSIATASLEGLAVPAAAVLFRTDGAYVQAVKDQRVSTRRIEIGLRSGALIEVRSGLETGDLVVAKAGTFLRDGDAVRPLLASTTTVSEGR